MPIRPEGFCPGMPERGDVADRSVGDVLRKLESSGFVSTHTIWSETSGQAYLSDSRTVTAAPDDDANDGWDFDNADDFDERNTVACPSCGTGRVGFLIS